MGMNVFMIASVYLLRWPFRSPVGHWLEIDKPTKAYVPEVS